MPIPCTKTADCTTEIITSLEGFIKSDDAFDTQACFDLVNSDYVGNLLILSQILDRWEVIGLCGNTGLGLYYYGCSGGSIDQANATPTGEMVVAQVCDMQCLDYILDPTLNPVVLMAEIGGQWFIINVLDRPSTLTTKDGVITTVCADACCGIGFKYIEVTIGTGCGSLSNQTFQMIGSGGSWSGQITAGGDTFLMSISCSIGTAGAEDWSINGGCGSTAAATSSTVTCGTNSISGTASFSSMTCGACSSVSVTFVSIEIPDRVCETVTLTGVEVVMEACGVPPLAIDDKVILIEIPKNGADCSPTLSNQDPQWQMLQVCSNQIECGDDCDPPPPEDADCCNWNDDTVPQTLVGTLEITSDDDGCVCSGTATFERVADSIPPQWNLVGTASCPNNPPTGTAIIGALVGLAGWTILCANAGGSGTGSGSGSGSGYNFTLTLDGCATTTQHVAEGSCDPLIISWTGMDIVGCCTGGVPGPTSVTLDVEVTAA